MVNGIWRELLTQSVSVKWACEGHTSTGGVELSLRAFVSPCIPDKKQLQGRRLRERDASTRLNWANLVELMVQPTEIHRWWLCALTSDRLPNSSVSSVFSAVKWGSEPISDFCRLNNIKELLLVRND